MATRRRVNELLSDIRSECITLTAETRGARKMIAESLARCTDEIASAFDPVNRSLRRLERLHAEATRTVEQRLRGAKTPKKR